MTQKNKLPLSPYMGGVVDVATAPNGEIANRRYLEHGKQFARKVHKVVDGVWCHVGASLGNSTMIEGDTGIIVIDTGDCIEQAQMMQDDFRQICTKPLTALIYSHGHYIFGSRAWIAPEDEAKVQVWAHEDMMQTMARTAGDLSPFILRRAVIQFGMKLPKDGPDSLSNLGTGPFFFEFDKYQPTTGFVRPNKNTTDGLETTIDGVKVQFFHAWGDTEDTILIWLPEKKTIINNIAWPAMFNIYTLRGESYRNPIELLRGLEKILELAPEHLVGVHGAPIHGRDEIRRAIIEYRDTIQFTYDQTIRGINGGLSPDELVQFVQLPESLAKGRLTQQFYGELPHHVRQIYSGNVGWFGNDSADLHKPAPEEQAKRIVALAGGVDKFVTETKAALAKKEYAWAAQMATWLLQAGHDGAEHKQLKADALRAMGQVTTAANARGWYLTQALELEGKIDTRVMPMHFINTEMVKRMPPRTYVVGLRFAIPPALSADGEKTIAIRFTKPDLATTLLLRNGVVVVSPQDTVKPDAALEMNFETWAKLVGRGETAEALVASGHLRCSGDQALCDAVLIVGQPPRFNLKP